METPTATTFFDEHAAVEVEVVSVGANGLCRVKFGDRELVRHRDRLVPTNEEARRLLK